MSKTCPRCETEKAFDAFSKDKHSRDGRATYCKECNKARHRVGYQANREERLLKQRQYYEENKEACQLRNKAYYEENREVLVEKAVERVYANYDRHKELARNRYAADPEKTLEAQRLFRLANLDRYRAKMAARRALVKQATPDWADQTVIGAIYSQAALLTEQTGVKHSVDHVIPLSHPSVCGLHVPANLRVISLSENCSKGNDFDEWWIDDLSIAA